MRIKDRLSKVWDGLVYPINVLRGKEVIEIDRRIIALHEENREIMDRRLELAAEHIEALKALVDVQGSLIEILERTATDES